MPESMLDELIDVYSRYTVLDEAVHAEGDYKQLCDKHSGVPAFDALRDRTERDKKELERLVGKGTPQSQVKEALKGIRRRRGPLTEPQYGFVELALKSYGASWTASQREYFTAWSDRIIRSQDYFLSFTNRNLTPGFPNIVNTNHEFFIRSRIDGWDTYDRSKENLLALAIHYLLRSDRLTGFFFPWHEDDSYDVETKLKEECGRALVFIQLVQGAMFISSPSYCGLEYETADRALPAKPRVFIDAEEDLPTDDTVDPNLLEWYEAVSTSARTMLAPTADLPDPQVIARNHAVVKGKVIECVHRATSAVYDGVPAI